MNHSFGERSEAWILHGNPSELSDKDSKLTELGTSMNAAVSFGFLATAIFISMFLLMAIFEHLLRPRSCFPRSLPRYTNHGHRRAQANQQHLSEKLANLEPVMTPYQSGFSVLMPGQQYPTCIAQPAPLLPCQREGMHWPLHDHYSFPAK